jgi:transcriptional regulator of arginine metabolism
MNKRERQSRILELIENEDIETQEELAEILNKEGYSVTQATVSRDINELKISKVPTGGGRQKYAAMPGDDSHLASKYIRVLKDAFVSMDNAQNILVVRTVSGMAMAVAAALDAMRMKEVVGSIAGDDTIMMAIRTTEETKLVMDRIRDIL